MARKDKVNSAYQMIVGSDQRKPAREKPYPVSVLLENSEIEELAGIAFVLGVSRHEVLQFAVRDFLARYKRGERPQVKEVKVKKLTVD